MMVTRLNQVETFSGDARGHVRLPLDVTEPIRLKRATIKHAIIGIDIRDQVILNVGQQVSLRHPAIARATPPALPSEATA